MKGKPILLLLVGLSLAGGVRQAVAANILDLTAELDVPSCTLTLDNVAAGNNFTLPDVNTPKDLLNQSVVGDDAHDLQLTVSCSGYKTEQLSLQLTSDHPDFGHNDNKLFMGGSDSATGVGVVAHMDTNQCTALVAYTGACAAQDNEHQLNIGTAGQNVPNTKVYVRFGLSAGKRTSFAEITTGSVRVPLTFKARYP